MTPLELEVGQRAKIIKWVNQPRYTGDILENRNGTLTKITNGKFESTNFDQRYMRWCEIKLIESETESKN